MLRIGLLFASNVTRLSAVLLVYPAPATVEVSAVGGIEVLTTWVTSPPYVASTNAVPIGSSVVLTLAVPLDNVKGPIVPSTVAWSLFSAIKEISPVGVPDVDVTFTVAANVVPVGDPPPG